MTVLLLASARTAAAPTITEFPIPTAASSIVAGPDGALWYNQRGGKKIGRITTAGTVTEFLIPVPPRAWVYTGLAAGSDGALWFGIAKSPGEFPGPTSRSIWRITTTGEFSEFLLPPSDSAMFTPNGTNGITTGPDGALWLTGVGTGKIDRITTTGVIAEFLLPTRNNSPFGITAGPDGALWFRNAWYKIGRITTTGEFNEFVLPTPHGDPAGITAGPDGALWFTEGFHDRNNGDKIGRITTAGAISEFLLPTPNSGPLGITAGADGALWFAERAGNKIGRIAPTGELNEFPLPTSIRGPMGITAGPDGAVWFTGWGFWGGKIGRIGQSDEDVKADLQTFHWERWILSLEILTSLAIIIARRLKRLHLH
jgi:streptogramin lyase